MKNQTRKSLAYWALAALVVVATLGLTRVAIAAYSAAPQIQFEAPGSLSGLIKAEDTASPIASVSVSLFDAINVAPYPVYFGSTDAEGLFRIEGIAPGKYLIQLKPSADSIYQTIFYEDSTPLEIRAEQKLSIEATLPRSGLITGIALDQTTNEPLADVTISAYTYGQDEPISQTKSGSDGTYILSNLAGETVWLIFTATTLDTTTRYLPYHYLSQLTVTAPDHKTGINARLQQGAQISGLVSDSVTDAPIDGATVTVYSENNQLLSQTRTGADGTYRTAGLHPGRYKLCFSKRLGFNQYADRCYASATNITEASAITLGTAEQKRGINISLLLRSTTGDAKIAGRVTDAATGTPLSSIRVRLYDPQGVVQNSAQTLETGFYTFTNLAEGEYILYFSAETGFDDVNYIAEYYNNAATLDEAESISVGDEDSRTDLNVELQHGGGISGAVKSDETGRGLSSIRITLRDESGENSSTTITDADGLFSFNRLATGNYSVEFTPAAENATYLGEFYNDALSQQDATFVSVTAPNVTDGLTISLRKGSLIAGTVTGADNSLPLTGVNVVVYTQNGCTPVATAVTDTSGAYTASPALETGEYRVEFTPNHAGASRQYLPEADASFVQIAQPGYFGDIDATLALGAVIYGRIVAADSGLPLERVTIRPVFADGSSADELFYTNAAGLFTSYGLPAQNYTLELNNPMLNGLASSTYATKSSIEIALSAAQTVEHNDILARGGQISGRIVAADTGSPLASVNVALYNGQTGSIVSFASSAEDGTYRFGGLTDSAYKVQFQPASTIGAAAAYRWAVHGGAMSIESGREVIIQSANSITDINAMLNEGGQISGTVFDKSNEPLPSVVVLVIDQTGNILGQSVSDQDGSYITNGLPDGEAIVSFYQSSIDDQCQSETIDIFYNNKPDASSANPVTVVNGTIASSIDVVMDPAAVPVVTPTPDVTATPTATPKPTETAVGNTPTSTPTPIPSNNSTYLPFVNQ